MRLAMVMYGKVAARSLGEVRKATEGRQYWMNW